MCQLSKKILLFIILLISVFLIAAVPEDAVRDDIVTSKTIESKYITTKNGKDYITDTTGITQEILINPDEAAEGEVFYYGKYEGKKLPFLVLKKENGKMTVVSIPKFNIERETAEYDTPEYYDNNYEKIAFLNTEFIDKIFNKKEEEKIVEKVYEENYTHFDNIKKFDVKYRKKEPSKKFGGSYITMKIFEQYDYGNTYCFQDLDHTKPTDYDKLSNFRNSVWYLTLTNQVLNKKVDFKDVDIKIDLGVEKFTQYRRVVFDLKYDNNEIYFNKVNGFKEIDGGLVYLEEKEKVTNAIRSKDGEDFYLDDDGKAHNLKVFKIEKISGIPVFMCGNIVGRNIIIENGKKYVDFNGVVHDLHTEYDDFKNAKVSDSIVFGHEKDNEEKRLIWRVVNVDNGVITAIMEDKIKFWRGSNYIENRQISEYDASNTWEKSQRRKYLNEYFYNESFNDFEKEKIIANNITADAFFGSDNFTGTGKDTLDKVFFYDRNSYDYMKTYDSYGEKLSEVKPQIYDKTKIVHDPYSGEDTSVKIFNFKLSENSIDSVRPWILINTSGDNIIVNTKDTNEDYIFVESAGNVMTAEELLSAKDYKHLELGHYQKRDDESWFEDRGEKSVEIDRRVLWRVLGATDDTVYYITQNTIDVHPIIEGPMSGLQGFFSKIFGSTNGNKWSESYIRKWLNSEFLNNLFDVSEKEYLNKIKKKHTYVDKDGNLKTEECEDFITLLSYDEYNLYENAVSGGNITAFAESKMSDKKMMDFWDLSTIDSKTGYFYGVDKKNNKIKLLKTNSIAIRPCIAVKRNKLDSKKNLPEIKKSRDKSYKIKYQNVFKDNLFADTINFGSYDIDGTGKKDLEWQIVTRKQNYALLISKDILFYENFIGKYGMPSWNKSDVRVKLNRSFYDEAFTDEEKQKILPIKNHSKYNIIKVGDIDEEDEAHMDEWGDVLEDETIDRLFIPKKNDFIVKNKYFGDEKEILSVEEPLNNLNKNMPDGEKGVYWLREGDINGFYAIDKNGYVAKEEDRKSKSYGVRPMMWVDMGDVK